MQNDGILIPAAIDSIYMTMAQAQDPPAHSSSQARHDKHTFPSKRRRPPRDIDEADNPDQRHAPPTIQQLYNRSHHHRQQQQHHHHQPDLIMPHDCSGRDIRPSLRKRGSSLRPSTTVPSRHGHHDNNYCIIDVASTHEEEGYATLRNKHHSQSSTTTTIAIKNIHSTVRLSRIIAILLVCMLTYWASLWGVELSIGIAKWTLHLMFGSGKKELRDSTAYSSIIRTMDDESLHHHDTLYEDSHQSTYGMAGLRGSIDANPIPDATLADSSTRNFERLSIHDLNAKSHLLKAQGRQILLDDEQLPPMQGTDEDGQGDKSYMGQDATHDFFFAGEVMQTERIVNDMGRIDTVSYLAHSYVTLPVSLDDTSFALSIWVNLSPIVVHEERSHPRVILSTSSKGSEGCYSVIFGKRPTSGFVLYAEPHKRIDGDIDREESAGTTYRIILEYSQAGGAHSCQAIVGSSQQNNVLIEVGSWHHVALFATATSTDGVERLSVYVNGFLAGRTEDVSRRHSNSHSESTTTVGRYSTHHDEAVSGSNSDTFDLNGRVGMLSLWETESHASLSEPQRMSLQSPSDEDHVTRAIFRAAFDIRAIQELALQGLTVKEPSLLYTLDGQNGRDAIIDLYSEPDRSILEHMSGKRNGSIVSEAIHDNPVHHRQPFIPLGGNRYTEYKDGSYVPPILTASERQELNEIARARSVRVKKAMQHAWRGYETYAYGKDELLPISKGGQDNWGGMGTTLVDSLSTLWIMGLKDEFWKARDWVRDSLDFNQVKGGVSVFETTIRNLAGLLSAYDLSGDKAFLDKSDDLGIRLMRAFGSRTGIPYGEVELFDGGRTYNTGWHSNEAVLSEIGTLQVEFRYLAKVTGKSEYATEVMRALDELLKLDSESGLFPTFIHNTKQVPSFANDEISLGAMGDSFYEYLLKVWLQGGKREMKYRHMYDKSINGIIDKLVHMSRPNYLTYVAELKGDRVIHKMDHLACFLGGTLALGAYTHPDGLESITAQRQLKTGKQLAYTCYQMYARSKSGLSPEFVRFDKTIDDFAIGNAPYYILRPETVETLFILYHLTKDPVYREWGWEIFQAIEEHCKTDAGYAAIQNVDTMEQNNRMESFFLAETLKYLYLLQDDANDIDLLNTHVLNTEAHPLRFLV